MSCERQGRLNVSQGNRFHALFHRRGSAITRPEAEYTLRRLKWFWNIQKQLGVLPAQPPKLQFPSRELTGVLPGKGSRHPSSGHPSTGSEQVTRSQAGDTGKVAVTPHSGVPGPHPWLRGSPWSVHRAGDCKGAATHTALVSEAPRCPAPSPGAGRLGTGKALSGSSPHLRTGRRSRAAPPVTNTALPHGTRDRRVKPSATAVCRHLRISVEGP